MIADRPNRIGDAVFTLAIVATFCRTRAVMRAENEERRPRK